VPPRPKIKCKHLSLGRVGGRDRGVVLASRHDNFEEKVNGTTRGAHSHFMDARTTVVSPARTYNDTIGHFQYVARTYYPTPLKSIWREHDCACDISFVFLGPAMRHDLPSCLGVSLPHRRALRGKNGACAQLSV
jgi:hypothetical protein